MDLVGQDIVVILEPHYGLDGQGIEGDITCAHPDQPTVQWVLGLFPGGTATGAWHWPPTPSSAEVKDEVELYLRSPSGSSWPVPG